MAGTSSSESKGECSSWLLFPTSLFIFLCSFFRPTDPDFWWHVRTGQLIVETMVIPTHDPFSFPSEGAPWIAHEWLAEVVYYLVHNSCGYSCLSALYGCMSVVTLLALFNTTRMWGTGVLLSWMTAVFGSSLTLIVGGVRPQGFTVLLQALTMLVLTRFDRKGSVALLWLLVPLVVLWVNLHGGFIIGVCTILLWYGGKVVGTYGVRRSALNVLTTIPVVLVCVGVLANPHGIHAVLYPFSYAGSGNASMVFLHEWQSPDFHSMAFIPLLCFLVVAVLVGLFGAPVSLFYSTISTIFVLLALRSARHSALLGVVASPVIAARLQTTVAQLDVFLGRFSVRMVGILLTVSVFIFSGLVVEGRIVAHLPQQYRASPDTSGCPSALISALAQQTPGPIFNEYSWGGYIINTLYPDWKVFIDGRADVHGDAHMQQYYDAWNGGRNWRGLFEKFRIKYVVVAREAPLVGVLRGEAEWRELASDQFGVVFVHGIHSKVSRQS